MTICDRCHSPHAVERFTVEMYIGKRPEYGIQTTQLSLDLCLACRKGVQVAAEREMKRKSLD